MSAQAFVKLVGGGYTRGGSEDHFNEILSDTVWTLKMIEKNALFFFNVL